MTNPLHTLPQPAAVIIAGSGLSQALAALLPEHTTHPYTTLPQLPQPPHTVPGHTGHLLAGHTPTGTPVWIFAGRFHTYQGLTAADVALPVRIAADHGAQILITTNAAGTTRAQWNLGDVVGITDHINATGHSALTGPTFVDLSDAYCPTLRAAAASSQNEKWREGVYAATAGPAYETAAEVQWLTIAGADLVGMSTVHETVTARAEGLRVCGLSVITNYATGIALTPHNHTAVLAAAGSAAPRVAAAAAAVLATGP